MKTTAGIGGDAAADLITRKIESLGDWRGETLARMRALIRAADPDVVETWKWGGPVWEHDGVVCTGETYKDKVKLTFAKGAALPDPRSLFNASLDGGTRRAIDLRAGDRIDGRAFSALFRAAVVHNGAKAVAKRTATSAGAKKRATKSVAKDAAKPAAKDATEAAAGKPATIAAYLAAAPGAGRPLLRRLHAILAEAAPHARQVMKWNAPFFVEPRFLYSWSATKDHANLAATAAALHRFRDELKGRRTTKYFLQLPYDEPLPEDLIRRIAEYRVAVVAARTDDSFWGPEA
jgi:hypothetical protein